MTITEMCHKRQQTLLQTNGMLTYAVSAKTSEGELNFSIEIFLESLKFIREKLS